MKNLKNKVLSILETEEFDDIMGDIQHGTQKKRSKYIDNINEEEERLPRSDKQRGIIRTKLKDFDIEE